MSTSHRGLFLRKFLTCGTRIASVTPSSRWMSRELAKGVSPEKPQRILELGAGTGVVTRVIRERMHPDSTLVAFEPDRDLAGVTRGMLDADRDGLARSGPRTRVIEKMVQDATDADFDADFEDGSTGDGFDVVVSGLPVPSFTKPAKAALFDLLRERAPGASYSQLTEIPMVYKPLYARVFERVRFVWVPLNMPPGGVYHCAAIRT